jgi:hypothetical protein
MGRKMLPPIQDNERRYFLYAIDVDLDLDAQFYAIQSLLANTRNADLDLTRRIEQLARESEAVTGRRAELVVDEWVDALHRSIYQDAAHSLAAVGMIAPLLESVLVQSFAALGRVFDGPISHPRFGANNKERWNCRRYLGDSGKWRDGFVRGTMQLSEALDLGKYLPLGTDNTLSALFAYRNVNFHNGLEWPVAARIKFLDEISIHGWTDWFSKSESDHKPKIIYMTRTFIDHRVSFSGALMDGLGGFAFDACQDGRIKIDVAESPGWLGTRPDGDGVGTPSANTDTYVRDQPSRDRTSSDVDRQRRSINDRRGRFGP